MLDLIDQPTGESLMRWTIRIAVACILLRFAARWAGTDQPMKVPSASECWFWAAGFFLYVLHVVLAFHFVHDWSHARAWQHTAQETARLTGLHRGEGIWLNYAFTFIWALDVIRLVVSRLRERPTARVLDVTSFFIFGFICFNATVVFGPIHYRLLAICLFFALFLTWRRGRARAGSPPQ